MTDDDEQTEASKSEEEKARKEALTKQLAMVVCICKGIPLHRILPGLEGSDTVADVNRKVGCGSGGCKGERCGPRVKKLLQKQKELEQKKRGNTNK